MKKKIKAKAKAKKKKAKAKPNPLAIAVRALGGPHRASSIYNAEYEGQIDPVLGEPVERLARSTLETWLFGTNRTKGTDIIRRLIELSKLPAKKLDKLARMASAQRRAHGKTKEAAEAPGSRT
jgi:hypothetical protein